MEIVPLSFDSIDPDKLTGLKAYKGNELIEAQYKLPNLIEQRIIFLLLAQIKQKDEDFKVYRIPVIDFAKMTGIKVDGAYKELERSLRTLMARIITIKQGKSFLMMSWLSSARYEHGSGYVDLSFDPNLKPYLLGLKGNFTEIELTTALNFKSIYAIRLYEILKRHWFKKKQFEVMFSYEELREKFSIDKKEYPLFSNFKIKTIIPAITEICDKSDLNIYDVIYKKTGRAVSHILFKIEKRDDAEAKVRAVQIRLDEQTKEKTDKREELKKRLVELGYSFEAARRDVNKYGIQRIERSIAYTLAKQQEGKVKDFPCFLSETIKQDFGGAWEHGITEKKGKAEQAKQIEREKEEREEKKRVEDKKRAKQLISAFYILPDDEKEEIGNAFVKQEKNIMYSQLFKDQMEDGELKDQVLKSKFAVFLMARGF